MHKQLINALEKRYATKKFDANRKLSSELINALIEAIRLTPTSYGLQLMKVVIVENSELRQALLKHSYKQEQVVDASHLIVLCREKEVDPAHISAYVSNISKTRAISEDKLEGYKTLMTNSVFGMSEQQRNIWMDKQVYIALGQLLTACAILSIDACPMEGFVASEYDNILRLSEKNLSSVLVIPVGYHAQDDQNALAQKVRRSTADFLVTI